MSKRKTLHGVVDPPASVRHQVVRAVCGVVVGENRRTHVHKRVTCKRCRKILGLGETWAQARVNELGPRKPPKRALGRKLSDLATPGPGPSVGRLLAAVTRDEHELREKYAGAIGLLCVLSTQLRDDNLDSIEAAVRDFCKLTGWTYRRTLHRIEVFPPVSIR